MERIDVAVIGAGVTGLASALALAARGRSVCVLERHPRPGSTRARTTAASSTAASTTRPARSNRGSASKAGRLLYEFCADHGVPHARCGKLIVAADDERDARGSKRCCNARRRERRRRTRRWSTARSSRRREPNIRAVAAIFSPETGIVDAEALVRALLRAGEAAGVIFLPGHPARRRRCPR